AVGDRKAMHTRSGISYWCHEPKPEEASITEQQRALDRHAEHNLDVPEALLLKASPFGKRFDTGTCSFEGFTLTANTYYWSAHIHMTQRLNDRCSRSRQFHNPLDTALSLIHLSGGFDAA